MHYKLEYIIIIIIIGIGTGEQNFLRLQHLVIG